MTEYESNRETRCLTSWSKTGIYNVDIQTDERAVSGLYTSKKRGSLVAPQIHGRAADSLSHLLNHLAHAIVVDVVSTDDLETDTRVVFYICDTLAMFQKEEKFCCKRPITYCHLASDTSVDASVRHEVFFSSDGKEGAMGDTFLSSACATRRPSI